MDSTKYWWRNVRYPISITCDAFFGNYWHSVCPNRDDFAFQTKSGKDDLLLMHSLKKVRFWSKYHWTERLKKFKIPIFDSTLLRSVYEFDRGQPTLQFRVGRFLLPPFSRCRSSLLITFLQSWREQDNSSSVSFGSPRFKAITSTSPKPFSLHSTFIVHSIVPNCGFAEGIFDQNLLDFKRSLWYLVREKQS